eukprot:SAG11_NODE_8841_length_970_cov_6.071183_1_plen_87_part_10
MPFAKTKLEASLGASLGEKLRRAQMGGGVGPKGARQPRLSKPELEHNAVPLEPHGPHSRRAAAEERRPAEGSAPAESAASAGERGQQ